jgi:ribosomal protein L40E
MYHDLHRHGSECSSGSCEARYLGDESPLDALARRVASERAEAEQEAERQAAFMRFAGRLSQGLVAIFVVGLYYIGITYVVHPAFAADLLNPPNDEELLKGAIPPTALSKGWVLVTFLVMQVAVGLFLWSYYLASRGPGFVPPGWTPSVSEEGRKLRPEAKESWCAKCNSLRPPRAHHCRYCRRCVLLQDHHCPWIHTCVGFQNFKSFFQLLVYAIFCSAVTSFFFFYRMTEVYYLVLGPEDNTKFCLGMGLLASVVFFGFTLIMLIDHVKTIRSNVTYIEGLISKKTGARVNIFDMGAKANFRAYLGEGIISLLWPTNAIPKGGFDFPVNDMAYVDGQFERAKGNLEIGNNVGDYNNNKINDGDEEEGEVIEIPLSVLTSGNAVEFVHEKMSKRSVRETTAD